MASQFPNLFSPIQIGNMTVRNRIVNTAHGTNFARDHMVTDRHIHYHVERAKGGVGMSIMEATSVHPSYDIGVMNTIWSFDERNIPWFRRLSRAVHQHQAKILVQLNHGGRQSSNSETMMPSMAPSPVPSPDLWETGAEVPHEMDEDDIMEIVRAFGQAAAVVKEGGMDGVELHGGHGNLIQQFMSPWVNRRGDQYGGNIDNRLRFANQVIGEVRRNVGDEFVVGMRISGDEFVSGGLTLDDMQEIARRLAATGQIDYFNVSNSTYSDVKSMTAHIPSMYVAPATYSYLWEGIKNAVDIPVIGVGRINTADLAEWVLAERKADMVGMVRELIADPYLPNKAREGKLDDIRACVACLESCIGRLERGLSISCIYNPVSGREREWSDLKPASTRKSLFVVGGGPAGLEAARVAAVRGHEVTLFEKSEQLGGQVKTAAQAPYREEFGGIVGYLESQVRKLGVDVVLGKEASEEMILEANPHAVVIATGSNAYIPQVPGSELGIVISAKDAMEGKVDLGEKIVVVDTQGLHPGSDVAELLADQGREVQLITTKPYVGASIELLTWRILYQRLMEKGVKMFPSVGLKEIGEDSVTVYSTITKEEWQISAVDAVVFAAGGQADNGLYRALKGKLRELFAVGDCVAPRGVEQAVYEGHKVGREL